MCCDSCRSIRVIGGATIVCFHRAARSETIPDSKENSTNLAKPNGARQWRGPSAHWQLAAAEFPAVPIADAVVMRPGFLLVLLVMECVAGLPIGVRTPVRIVGAGWGSKGESCNDQSHECRNQFSHECLLLAERRRFRIGKWQ